MRRNSIEKSIRAAVNCIQFEYEMGNVDVMCWLLRSASLADQGTKVDSPLRQAFQFLTHTRKIPIDLCKHKSRWFDWSHG